MATTFKFGNGNWAVKEEAALAYNSENNNFKPLPFTFDRASTATVVNKNGLIETVGVDEPRIDFLNNTKGHLLLEPSRQNLNTYSEDIESFTQFTNVTATNFPPFFNSLEVESKKLSNSSLSLAYNKTRVATAKSNFVLPSIFSIFGL